MDTIDSIFTRRSYRGRYTDQAVPHKHLETIMQAGLAAPSGCKAVDDPELLARLHTVIDPDAAESAPAMIFVLSRPIKACRDRCFAVQDCGAAIENMLLAIHAPSYASCLYEGHITDDDRICDKPAAIPGVPAACRCSGRTSESTAKG
ncbi:nitroreductase family protein [uncultured Ruminococcus sp.]|uniref:nitroreductase family protein n=1 Tax=uncultured Ruminococcus sp. TaxID=165186 RepID=UPI0025D1860F|nr:nitroreductase family protein [uncultured Ruminococcus sp.]